MDKPHRGSDASVCLLGLDPAIARLRIRNIISVLLTNLTIVMDLVAQIESNVSVVDALLAG